MNNIDETCIHGKFATRNKTSARTVSINIRFLFARVILGPM